MEVWWISGDTVVFPSTSKFIVFPVFLGQELIISCWVEHEREVAIYGNGRRNTETAEKSSLKPVRNVTPKWLIGIHVWKRRVLFFHHSKHSKSAMTDYKCGVNGTVRASVRSLPNLWIWSPSSQIPKDLRTASEVPSLCQCTPHSWTVPRYLPLLARQLRLYPLNEITASLPKNRRVHSP
jgi:hypothetical protein